MGGKDGKCQKWENEWEEEGSQPLSSVLLGQCVLTLRGTSVTQKTDQILLLWPSPPPSILIPLFCCLLLLNHLKAFFFFFALRSQSPLMGALTGFLHLWSSISIHLLMAPSPFSLSLGCLTFSLHLFLLLSLSLLAVPLPCDCYFKINVKHYVGFKNSTSQALWRVSCSSEKLQDTGSQTLSTPRLWRKPLQTAKAAGLPF